VHSQQRKGPVCHVAVVMLVAAVLLAGCGSSAPPQSNEQQVRNVVNHFTVDAGQADYKAACALTTGQVRASCAGLESLSSDFAHCSQVSPTSQVGQGCASLKSEVRGMSSFTSLTISKVVISGSSATVAFNGSAEVMTLSKQGGKWLIATA
jgi:hypothetical protein